MAHSMGGLLCEHYLKTNVESTVSRLITFGTPWNGGGGQPLSAFVSGYDAFGLINAQGVRNFFGCSPCIFNLIPIRFDMENVLVKVGGDKDKRTGE